MSSKKSRRKAESESESESSESESSSVSSSSASSSEEKPKKKSTRKAAATKSKAGKGSTTKKRKKKDPNAPKKARTPYVAYVAEVRATTKAANPSMTFGELSRKIAQDWKELTDDEKTPYQKIADDDKKRYEKEKKNYKAPESSSDDSDSDSSSDGKKKKRGKKPAKKKAKKDPNAPKRASNAYMFFVNDKRKATAEANPNMKGKEVVSYLAGKWKEMSDSEKNSLHKNVWER